MKLIPILLIMILLTACGGQTPPPATPQPAPTSTMTQTPTAIPVTATPAAWCTTPLPEGFAIIGYLPEYRELNPEWGKCLTDIVYFSAEPHADGTLDTSRLSDATWQGLRAMKAKYGTRIHLSVGGWERSAGFAPMSASVKTRATFVKNLLDFLLANQLDGADFDWEFPENETQFKDYIALLTEVKAAFAPHELAVSVALSADNATSMDVSQFKVVDRIHVMSYDRGLLHSTYNFAVEDLNTFTIKGLEAQQLILGVPFYGRLIAKPYTPYTYQDIMTRYHPPADQDQMDGIYFNGIKTIQYKTCFVREHGFRGVMIWELGQDTWDETSLLRAIYQAAVNGC